VVHLQEILTDQGRFSRSARVIEPVDKETVIRDAASGLSAEMKAAVRIGVNSSGAETGAVAGARAALLQVITNLLVNAAESIQSAGPNAGQVTITTAPEKVQGQLMAHLRFADNGVGIQAEHIGRLFERGFSTKIRDASATDYIGAPTPFRPLRAYFGRKCRTGTGSVPAYPATAGANGYTTSHRN
jgi:signal transduction histidine kinase